jgi:crossover junction endodeoxyribonuclease RusA
MIKLLLPFPPSGNHRLQLARGKFFPSLLYKRFKSEVNLILHERQITPYPKGAQLGIQLLIEPPDRRQRDLDNIIKSLLDALKDGHNKAFADDYDLWHMEIDRGNVFKPNGRVFCQIWDINQEAAPEMIKVH